MESRLYAFKGTTGLPGEGNANAGNGEDPIGQILQLSFEYIGDRRRAIRRTRYDLLSSVPFDPRGGPWQDGFLGNLFSRALPSSFVARPDVFARIFDRISGETPVGARGTPLSAKSRAPPAQGDRGRATRHAIPLKPWRSQLDDTALIIPATRLQGTRR